jgi:hypothetical protein
LRNTDKIRAIFPPGSGSSGKWSTKEVVLFQQYGYDIEQMTAD